MSFTAVKDFENELANFFGSPYAVAVDCCTHGVELCLRYHNVKSISVPKRTYLSIPFLANKLNIDFHGNVWPCCFFGNSYSNNKNYFLRGTYIQEYIKYNKNI